MLKFLNSRLKKKDPVESSEVFWGFCILHQHSRMAAETYYWKLDSVNRVYEELKPGSYALFTCQATPSTASRIKSVEEYMYTLFYRQLSF
jgi:hypothetical protein